MGVKRKLLKWTLNCCSVLIPDRMRYVLLEDLRRTKKLDYEFSDIIVNVSSGWESARANDSCAEEPETVKWIEDYLKPGEVLYDIGANIGVYSLIAAKCPPGESKIYAFEPSFLTFKSLCENIVLNNCENSIIPLHMALSDRTAIDRFHYASLSPGDSQHTFGEKVDINRRPHKSVLSLYCPSFRLDDLIRQLNFDVPNHIKIDVDGIEFQILKGGREVLKSDSVRSLLVEVNEATSSANDISSLLNELGFILFAKHKHKAVTGNNSFSKIYNYIFSRG